MSHFRLMFKDGLHGRYGSCEEAERAVECHRQYGDDPEIIEVLGHYVGPQRYGEGGTVDGVTLSQLSKILEE